MTDSACRASCCWVKLLTFVMTLFLLQKQFIEAKMPFRLGIRDTFMIAHSFHNHASFGPAGRLHGATFTCDVEFITETLNPETNWVIDIGKASGFLSQVLSKYNYQNLDEVFRDGEMTTTEFMCRKIHEDLCRLLEKDGTHFEGGICVKLWESHKAWASYESEVPQI